MIKTVKKVKRVYAEADRVADIGLEKIKVSYATPVILLVIVLSIVGLTAWLFL